MARTGSIPRPHFMAVVLLSLSGLLGILSFMDTWTEDHPPTEKLAAPTTPTPQPPSRPVPTASPKEPGSQMHIIFSTECSTFHDWQSAGLIYSHKRLKHPGKITRLVSCNHDPGYTYNYDKASYVLSPLANPHPITKDEYPPYNRPASIAHWLEHATIEETTIIVLDPDEVLMNPFNLSLSPGRGAAQRYSVGDSWRHNAIGNRFCQGKCKDIQAHEAINIWNAGPPYMLHIDDLRRMMPDWLRLTSEIRNTPDAVAVGGWISEMYAYILAAVIANVPHTLSGDMMVSNVLDRSEGWHLASFDVPPSRWPHTLHYCQRYTVEQPQYYTFYKHDMHTQNYLQCPHGQLIPKYPDNIRDAPPGQMREHAWMIELLVDVLNESFLDYTEFHCPK